VNKVKSVSNRKNSRLMLEQGNHPPQPQKSYGTQCRIICVNTGGMKRNRLAVEGNSTFTDWMIIWVNRGTL
jgi:hypothetical protein